MGRVPSGNEDTDDEHVAVEELENVGWVAVRE
jgi:hypothetical protein